MTTSEDADFAVPPPSGADVFSADEEIGRDLALVDWAATPLGEPATWPQSLRTAVSILLSSRFSMWMAWGPQLTFFCNAAYRRNTLGHKYPWALGRSAREVWAEIWDDIGPRIDAVLAAGQATWDEALLLFLERYGYTEESYHTFSYSPLRDDSGNPAGMLCVVSEETERVIAERRMATLRDLGSDPSVVRTEQEMLSFTNEQLGRNPQDLPFALTYLFQDDGSARLVATTAIPAGHPAAPETLPAGSAAEWPTAAAASGRSVVVSLEDRGWTNLPTTGGGRPPAQAVVVPLLQQGGEPYGFMVTGLNRYRPFDEDYRGFVELVAGHVATGIASARSYQAQQRRAEELAELDRAKTTFFSNISHEFRTPLTLIAGPVQELQDRLADADPRVREELGVIHRNTLRLGKLVNTLLDFSRLEAGRMQARYEPVDLAVVTGELAGVFRSAMEKAGLALHVDCAALPEPVYIDRGMWEKVVLNLLSNALKFTFTGSVGVTVRAEDGQAVVVIEDTGTGIAAEELPRLFERFHRVENARSRSNEGSGIGLALVKELVGLHGGAITADSTEGQGTRFTIRLPFGPAHLPPHALLPAAGTLPAAGPMAPIAETSAPAIGEPFVQEALRWLPDEHAPATADVDDAGSDADPLAGGPQTSGRLLVADDNADMREYLTRLLRDAGYQVHAVDDGQQALAAIRKDAPDLVVSDVMMPRLDGLALVTALRADTRTASVPVLLLSARAGQEASIEGLQAGADDYLVKPFTAAELLARVKANVELARLRNHHARWRTALVDSLQEAFFVCDEDGAVIEINTAFTDMLGYGPDGLPYLPVHPWWPDVDTDPESHQKVSDAFAQLLGKPKGSYTIPVTHRAGHRVWVGATYNQVKDPYTGRTVIVGTFRDVTTEHYAIQRESALAALGACLSQATSLPEALGGSLDELKKLWHAECVVAAVFDRGDEPTMWAPATVPSPSWQDLPGERREMLTGLLGQSVLTPTTDHTGAGILLEHPEGRLVLWIDLGEQRPFTSEDQLLLSLLAGRLAQGLARAHQIDQQRETALALQRAILGPAHLPDGFAVRYEPATRPLEVGGDWYDTVTLPDGRIAIVVGDCVGRGLQAASVMGQLRSACRALLLQDASPARALMALDKFAASVPGAMCTTVFCGVLDAEAGQLTYSSAGHPPGILVHPDGTTHLLEEGRSLPLAVRQDWTRSEGSCTIPARSTLLLYTDGLVERRRRPLSVGIDEAGEALQDGRNTAVDALATDVMTRLAPAGGYDDDVALLLYRHPAPLEMSFPAESGQLAPVRKALRSWLDRCELPPGTVQDILVAAGEACANAIEHGHRNAPGAPVRFRAEASVDNVRLTIADTGCWKSPEPELNTHRGRGIRLMRALMQHVTVTPGTTGTIVDMHTRIA
ncbi:SpoIIE family protein phosphatase [Streptomyces cirratus]|uniref:SpoIIE family protein phosphatase n=1 Tax=Streptomyces cirratus TaxID=68187 RepID=UPI00167D22FF